MRRPSNIARLVITVVVDPVERFAWRSETDIAEKRREREDPFRMDTNPAPAVPRVGLRRRAEAAVLHPLPNAVLARSGSPVVARVAMFDVARLDDQRIAISQPPVVMAMTEAACVVDA